MTNTAASSMNGKYELYIPHDVYARQDIKIKMLIKEFGMTGYGVFWSLVEMMASAGGDYSINISDRHLNIIADDLKAPCEKLLALIESAIAVNLFTRHGDSITSASLARRMNAREQKVLAASERGRENVARRWEKEKARQVTRDWHGIKPDWFDKYVEEFCMYFPSHAKSFTRGEHVDRELHKACLVDGLPNKATAYLVIEGAQRYAKYLQSVPEQQMQYELKTALFWLKDKGWINQYEESL